MEERRKDRERRTKKTYTKQIKFMSAKRAAPHSGAPDLDLLETEEKKKKKRMAPRVLERMNDINKERKKKKCREGQIQTLKLLWHMRSPGIRRSYDIPHYTTAVSS